MPLDPSTTSSSNQQSSSKSADSKMSLSLQMCDICKGYYPGKDYTAHVKACSEYYQKLKSVK